MGPMTEMNATTVLVKWQGNMLLLVLNCTAKLDFRMMSCIDRSLNSDYWRTGSRIITERKDWAIKRLTTLQSSNSMMTLEPVLRYLSWNAPRNSSSG